MYVAPEWNITKSESTPGLSIKSMIEIETKKAQNEAFKNHLASIKQTLRKVEECNEEVTSIKKHTKEKKKSSMSHDSDNYVRRSSWHGDSDFGGSYTSCSSDSGSSGSCGGE